MARTITVNAKDGENAYTLERDTEASTAKLTIKGVITPALAKDLIEDLTPLAGAKKQRAPAPKPATAKAPPAVAPEAAS